MKILFKMFMLCQLLKFSVSNLRYLIVLLVYVLPFVLIRLLSRRLGRVTLPLKGTLLSIPLACRLAAKYLLLRVPTAVRVATLARELSL